MARLLLEGGSRLSRPGIAPVDPACLSAALYCLDAVPADDAALAELAQRALAAARAWSVTGDQAPARPPLGRGFSYVRGRWRDEAAVAAPVVILAPMARSLHAVTVLELCRRLGVPVAGVALRRFGPRRFFAEWRRDGSKLLRKVRRKLILGRDEHPDPVDTSLRVVSERLVDRPRDVRRLARIMGAPVRVVTDFGDLADDTVLTGRSVGLFTGGGILPAVLLEAFGHGVINVHTGHLPAYRGMDAVHAALLEGRPASVGLTAHYMAPQIDAGDVLTRFTIDPAPYSTAGALGNALAGVMPLMLVDAALGACSGRLRRIPQPARGGRRHYVLHPGLRPLVDECLARRHERAGTQGPSPARRTLDAVCADLT